MFGGDLGMLGNDQQIKEELQRWAMVSDALAKGQVDWVDGGPIPLSAFAGMGPNILTLQLYQLAGGDPATNRALEQAAGGGAPSVNFEPAGG